MYIKEFCDYLKYERNCSPQTIASYGRDLELYARFARQSLPETEAATAEGVEADERTLRRWMAAMMESGNSASSVNRRLSAMRSYFRYLMTTGRADADPTVRISGPKKEKPLPYFVRENDMERLLDDIPVEDTFEGKRNHFILEMFYDTGMRLSELTSLDVDGLDFSGKVIKVTGKRNKQRVIPMAPRLAGAAREYLGLRAAQAQSGTAALIIKENGARISNQEVRKIVCRELSLVTTMKKRSPHVLRHSFATAMLNHGADIEAVRRLLGHESLATTEIYTHTSLEELRKNYQHAHPRA